MDLRKFDLNLLLILDALLRERSVTQAAQHLGMSQPTVSAALNRLRAAFQDELFVKTSRGMEPSPLARELEAMVAQVLQTVRSGILNRTTFDARTSERTFVVIAGELGQMVFVDRLLVKFGALAPAAKLRFIFPDASERLACLKDGRADVAMGYFPQFARTNLFQQTLYSRPFVCVARTAHPALREGGLTIEKFEQLGHLAVAMMSNLEELVDSELRRLGIARRVAVELGHAAGAHHVLTHSDLIAVMPEMLATIHCRSGELRKWPIPVSLPRYDVKQYWHPTVNKDPGVVWLRTLIATEFHANSPPVSSEQPLEALARPFDAV